MHGTQPTMMMWINHSDTYMSDSEYLSKKEVEHKVASATALLEELLGQDYIPIVLILCCRLTLKYSLDIHWVLATIQQGYYNELPPAITDDSGNVKFNS